MIVPIALTSIVIIIVAIACRHFKNKNQANLMDAQDRAQRSKNFKISPNDGELFEGKEMTDLKKMNADENYYGAVNRDSVQFGPQAIEEYEVQYDPNNDFGIFGVGDPTRGGVQNLKEKMNLADGVKEADSSGDEDDLSVHRKNSKLSTKVNSGSNGHSGSRPGSGESFQDSTTKMMNVEDDNQLPEDKEIHSDNEEEEE